MSKIVIMNSYSIGQQKSEYHKTSFSVCFVSFSYMHTGLRAVAGQGSRPPKMLKVTFLKCETMYCVGVEGIGVWSLGEKKEAENGNRGSRV